LNGLGCITGAAIASHLDIDKIAFTGSTATGKEIMKLASIKLKNLSLETGGKSPLPVFEDADFTKAVTWAHRGIMYNMGQVCKIL
jgi:aldehyde dehydrogenase (NAD+)